MSKEQKYLGDDELFHQLIHLMRSIVFNNSNFKFSDWLFIEKFIKNNLISDREHNQKEYDSGYKAGVENGKEEAKKIILELSVKNFLADNGNVAELLKDVAKKIK